MCFLLSVIINTVIIIEVMSAQHELKMISLQFAYSQRRTRLEVPIKN